MSGPGFYRGTTHMQAPFFSDKDKKMIESKSWPESFSQKVDITKVKLSLVKLWVTNKVTELLGFEDDIVVDFCMTQLGEQRAADGDVADVDPRRLQINLTGFMGKKSGQFVKELWELLLNAQTSKDGVPLKMMEGPKGELMAKQKELLRIQERVTKLSQAASMRTESRRRNSSVDSFGRKINYRRSKRTRGGSSTSSSSRSTQRRRDDSSSNTSEHRRARSRSQSPVRRPNAAGGDSTRKQQNLNSRSQHDDRFHRRSPPSSARYWDEDSWSSDFSAGQPRGTARTSSDSEFPLNSSISSRDDNNEGTRQGSR